MEEEAKESKAGEEEINNSNIENGEDVGESNNTDKNIENIVKEQTKELQDNLLKIVEEQPIAENVCDSKPIDSEEEKLEIDTGLNVNSDSEEKAEEEEKETDKESEKKAEEEKETDKESEKKVEEEEKETDEKTEKETDKSKKKKSKGKIVVALILLFILCIFSVIFAILNANNEKIVKGVTINGIDVSAYTKEELRVKINEYIEKNQQKIIELKYKEQENNITPETVGTKYNSEEIISKAYAIGRDSNILVNNFQIIKAYILKENFELKGNPDSKLLVETMNNINANLEGLVQEASYYIEGETLYVVSGKDGIKINEKSFTKKVLEEINDFSKNASIIDIEIEETAPQPINIEKIHEEIYCEPQNAYVSENPTMVHPNVNGVDFAISIEEAEEIIKEPKEEYQIPLKITIADITLAELGEEAFPNELGTFTTYFSEGEYSRSNNIKLATKKVNGVVLLPGETFSYNAIVGKRTIEAGYKAAGAYSGGKVVQEVGGGICQVSSTLYNAVLYANLEIVERHNHCFESSYVAASRDATVSWGGPDFKFKNTRKYPIKIIASSDAGREIVSIYGLQEEEEYDVVIESRKLSTIGRKTEYVEDGSLGEGEEIVIQAGHDGCTSEAYRILKKDGQVISSTLLSRDTYNALSKIIKKGVAKIVYTEPVEEVVQTESMPVQEIIPELE